MACRVPVTFWKINSPHQGNRLNSAEMLTGNSFLSEGRILITLSAQANNCIVDDEKKLQDQYKPYLNGIHTSATLGDL
jgi:hypothetical protein